MMVWCSCGVAIHSPGGWSSHRAAHIRRGEDHAKIPRDEYLARFPDRDERGIRKLGRKATVRPAVLDIDLCRRLIDELRADVDRFPRTSLRERYAAIADQLEAALAAGNSLGTWGPA